MGLYVLASVTAAMGVIAWQDTRAIHPGSTLGEKLNAAVEWFFVLFGVTAVLMTSFPGLGR
jgi:hypothetical protein